MSRFGSLAVFALLVFAASATGSQFMPGQWYAGLAKPWFTPPPVVFPIAWTILYVMIAIAGWIAWRAGAMSAVAVWGVQLVLNALWSYLMFGAHRIDLALAEIAVLWLSIGAFVALTWRPARNAALLFLPYWAWVTFAAILNFGVWRLNPGA